MIEILKTDITTLHVDAIVNAANRALLRGGGVCGAIHAAAGPELQEELTERFPEGCPTGSAVATRGYRLPARYVIHAVGPIWNGGDEDEEAELASAYENAFARALELGDARTIAFPAISTGIYGFPKERAARIAIASMRAHEQRFDRIVAALFDEASKALYERMLASA